MEISLVVLVQHESERWAMFLGPGHILVTEYPDALIFKDRRKAMSAADTLAHTLTSDTSRVYVVSDYGLKTERRVEVCR